MPTKKEFEEYARGLNPIDDLMFSKMAESGEFCEEILRVILDDDELIVTENIPQCKVENLHGRSIIMDAKCVTGYGRYINIEVQKADNDDHFRRVRYNGSVLTTNITETGTKFEFVPDVCVIFISAFDTAPLAPDLDFAIKDDGASFQAGVDVLSRLTSGKVHIGVNVNYPANQAYTGARAEVHKFSGPHPVGNVGVQLHHIAPVAKGEVVWTINPLDVVFIGRLVTTGHYDVRRIVAVAGSEVLKPRYYTAMVGTALQALLQDQLKKDAHVRIISGNVLTGTRETADGALHYYDTMVTVIPEGDHHEFAGWAMPGFKKYSASRLFPAFLLPNREYVLDTNLHGGERAFVVSGQYERVFPMRIYPVNLLKAIMAKNIEQMEDLGIYEVAEEDFALCEFVCTSKIDSQRLVREGMDLMLREL